MCSTDYVEVPVCFGGLKGVYVAHDMGMKGNMVPRLFVETIKTVEGIKRISSGF